MGDNLVVEETGFYRWDTFNPLIVFTRGDEAIRTFLNWYADFGGPLQWSTDSDIVPPELLQQHVETIIRATTLLDAPTTVCDKVRVLLDGEKKVEDIDLILKRLMDASQPRYDVVPVATFQRPDSQTTWPLTYYTDSHAVFDPTEQSPLNHYHPTNGPRYGGRWQSLARRFAAGPAT